MARIKAFRGIRYSHPATIPDLTPLVAPPYDVISGAARRALSHRHPQNVVRLILPTAENGARVGTRYAHARRLFDEWLAAGVLVRDPDPALYVYRQTFTHQGQSRAVYGVIALLALEEWGHGVLPHEQTFPRQRADRLALLRAVQANLDPIYGLFPDPEGWVTAQLEAYAQRTAPVGQVEEQGSHTLWRLPEGSVTDALAARLAPLAIVIADGHHRYHVALEYAREVGALAHEREPAAYVMAFLTACSDRGPVIQPVHRLLGAISEGELDRWAEGLTRWFTLRPCAEVGELLTALQRAGPGARRFGLYRRGRVCTLLEPKGGAVEAALPREISRTQQALDVVVLHQLVLHGLLGRPQISMGGRFLGHTLDPAEAVAHVERGRYQVAVLVNPPGIEQVRAVAEAHERMPQKSTYFFPKPLTGLVMHLLREPA